MAVLQPDFQHGFVAAEGHPCPEVFRRGDQIEIVCDDKDEPFQPPVECPITTSLRDLKLALKHANQELHVFAERIAASDVAKGAPDLARLLVFGKTGSVTATQPAP